MSDRQANIPFRDLKDLTQEWKVWKTGVAKECVNIFEKITEELDADIEEVDRMIADDNKPEVGNLLPPLNKRVVGLHARNWVAKANQKPVQIDPTDFSVEEVIKLETDIKTMREKIQSNQASDGRSKKNWEIALEIGKEKLNMFLETGFCGPEDIKIRDEEKGYCMMITAAKEEGRFRELQIVVETSDSCSEEVRAALKNQILTCQREGDTPKQQVGFGRDMSNEFQVDYLFIICLFCFREKLDLTGTLKALRDLGQIQRTKALSSTTFSELVKTKKFQFLEKISTAKLGFFDSPFRVNRQRISVFAAMLVEDSPSERLLGSKSTTEFIKKLIHLSKKYSVRILLNRESTTFYEYLLYKVLTTPNPYDIYNNRTQVKQSGLNTVKFLKKPAGGKRGGRPGGGPGDDYGSDSDEDRRDMNRGFEENYRIASERPSASAFGYPNLGTHGGYSGYTGKSFSQFSGGAAGHNHQPFNYEDSYRDDDLSGTNPGINLIASSLAQKLSVLGSQFQREESEGEEWEDANNEVDMENMNINLYLTHKEASILWRNREECLKALSASAVTSLVVIDIEGQKNISELAVVVIDRCGISCYVYHYMGKDETSLYCHALTEKIRRKSPYLSRNLPTQDLVSVLPKGEFIILCHDSKDVSQLAIRVDPSGHLSNRIMDVQLPNWDVRNQFSNICMMDDLDLTCYMHTGPINKASDRHHPHCALRDCLFIVACLGPFDFEYQGWRQSQQLFRS
ncbi:MAG: putative nucleoprotein [Hailar virus]|uniref:Nucleoprotein n=1 Tax=Hailar virus TaxID=3070921 RepID=A0AA48XDW1_9VIRU|nr:MAG: putative nucleoprotein [Inner Mongolia sediment arena-like virus]QYF49515.1 MAG: putative nucleoprotein [Hailar virus]